MAQPLRLDVRQIVAALSGLGVLLPSLSAISEDESSKGASSVEVERIVTKSKAPAACIAWKNAWVFYQYSPIDRKWHSWSTPPIAELPRRGGFSSVAASHSVVVDPLKNYSGWRFDLDQRHWREIPPSPLDGAAQGGAMYYAPIVVAVLPDRLFIWGKNRGPPHGAILDFATNRWSLVEEAPVETRWGAISGVIGGKVVIWGGYRARTKLDDGATFDVATGIWETIAAPPMPFAYGMVGTCWNGGLVIAAGRGQFRMMIYDVPSKKWTTSTDAPVEVGEYPAVTVLGDRVFLWSGHVKDSPNRRDGLTYDLLQKKWERIPAAPVEGRWLPLAFSDDERAIVWGGWLSSPDRFLTDGAEFDAKSGIWRRLAEMPGEVPRQLHPGW